MRNRTGNKKANAKLYVKPKNPSTPRIPTSLRDIQVPTVSVRLAQILLEIPTCSL